MNENYFTLPNKIFKGYLSSVEFTVYSFPVLRIFTRYSNYDAPPGLGNGD